VLQIYVLKQNTSKGTVSATEVALNEKESMWAELRHRHLGEAANIISERVKTFSQSKGAIFERGGATTVLLSCRGSLLCRALLQCNLHASLLAPF
jgi:hypothetical protein